MVDPQGLLGKPALPTGPAAPASAPVLIPTAGPLVAPDDPQAPYPASDAMPRDRAALLRSPPVSFGSPPLPASMPAAASALPGLRPENVVHPVARIEHAHQGRPDTEGGTAALAPRAGPALTTPAPLSAWGPPPIGSPVSDKTNVPDAAADLALSEPRAVEPGPRLETAMQRAAEPATPAVIRQILEQIQIRNGVVDVTLSPEELGRLTLSMSSVDNVLTVTISADRADTLDLIRRHAELLQQEARAAGFGSVTFGFSGDRGQGGHGAPMGGSGDGADASVAPDAPDHPAALSRKAATGGLDIRL